MAAADRRAEIDRLLMQALELEGEDRRCMVESIGEVELREAVVELLHLCESECAPFELDAAAAAGLIEAAARELPTAFGHFASALAFEQAALPERLGAWHVLERIGRGGMGEVLKVERRDCGFEQLGALKLIRAGYTAGEFLRRFVQERQILARLSHPGIAGLLDGGTDAQGRPFLVMEFVKGEAIDQYCDARCLDLGARIDLFMEVCRAVAHAHRNLVIHRDLKPSNILVSSEGRVKLLDFGIAKVLASDSDQDPLATRIEQRMFTPEYASPEQVRAQQVTTASDVYQLGLLLYELLCGKRAQAVGNSGPAAVERIVCNQQPLRPSQCVSKSDAALAARRKLQVTQLRRRLSGDLDTIVGKALQKLPDRRYGTVDELIDDLARSRDGRPLHARPDSFGYRLSRFVRRHPIGLGFAALTLALLGVYLVTLNLQAQALQHERDRAQAEAIKARQVQGLVQRLFEGIDPDISGGKPMSVRALLDRSWTQIESELGSQPEVQAELLLTVGDVYQALGDYSRAGELLAQAGELANALETEHPVLAARIYRSQGRLLGQGNQLRASEALMQKALSLFQAHAEDQPLQLATTLHQFTDTLRRLGETQRALAASTEALRYRRAAGVDSLDLASSLVQLSLIEHGLGHRESATQQLQEAIALMQPRLGDAHPRLAEARADLARMLRLQGELERSATLYLEAIESMQSSRGDEHPFLGVVLGNYANLLLERGELGSAEEVLRRALAIHQRAFGPVHARVALAHNGLGQTLELQGRFEGAITSYRAALTALPQSHHMRAAILKRNLAAAHLKAGQPSAALQVLETLESDSVESLQAQMQGLLLRAQALHETGQALQAADAARTSLQLSQSAHGRSEQRLHAHRFLALSLRSLGPRDALDESLARWREEIRTSSLPSEFTRRQLNELERLTRSPDSQR